MSASEKLKVLVEKPVLNMFKIGDALPQIVAVVEAAETFALCVQEEHQNERTYALDDALAALDEALS